MKLAENPVMLKNLQVLDVTKSSSCFALTAGGSTFALLSRCSAVGFCSERTIFRLASFGTLSSKNASAAGSSDRY